MLGINSLQALYIGLIIQHSYSGPLGGEFGIELRMLSFMVKVRQKFEKIEICTKLPKMDKSGHSFFNPNKFSSAFVLNASPKILRQIDFPVVLSSRVKSLDQTQR